jgi:hypothetical protein
MKRLKTVLVAMLLTSVGAMAMTAKVKDENKIVYAVLEGDSTKVHGKPGLSVDVKYKSEHVDIGVSADVNITISTGLSRGVLKVNLRPLKENTIDLAEQDLEFSLAKGGNTFPINLQVSSEENGIHYINLTMSVEGQSSRVVTVPVNIGTISEKLNTKEVQRTDKGVAISVSAAQEEIR